MSVLTDALDAIYADDNAASDALYASSEGGQAIPLRLRLAARAKGARLDEVRKPHTGPVARVRCSQLSSPESNAALTVDSRTFTVKRWDASLDGGEWLLELVEQRS
jgi:hypothetical protein